MKSKNKINSFVQLFTGIAIVVLLNIIGNYVFHRFDLTAEKRYTLSPATKKLLKELDDVVYFKIYLEGNFPSGFKKLRNETKEMLDEFRAYAGDNIQYTFINPSQYDDVRKNSEVYEQLYKAGILPTSIQVKTENGEQNQIIFPGALVSYHDKTLPLQLLTTQIATGEEETLNASIENLEYELASTLLKLTTKTKDKIAIITGQGELSEKKMEDITQALSEYYTVERVSLSGRLFALRGYKAAIIAKPDSAFNEKDKFIIDQFVMKGGRMLWLIDPVFASMDSLTSNNVTMGIANELNLEDILFKYGVRINTNLVLDVQSAPIPVIAGYQGNKPQYKFYPWVYFPIAFPYGNHPIVKNLNAVRFEFASSIDTIKTHGIKKTVLLAGSQYSRTINTPARIDLGILKKEPNPKEFNRSNIPLAILLEGKFESVFKNRLTPELAQSDSFAFKTEGVPTAMIIVSDGDVIRNQVQGNTGKVYPLGYDRYTQQQFGNKNFIMNCMNYLLDDSGLIEVRTRDIQIRLLDKTLIKENKLKWQLINILSPVFIIILYGFIAGLLRKRKFAR
ncbi:MAG: gliding motility-associated ABC transporter substrate-binding protein GldG [Bacteroidia bacterium]|nr:gliding motility-associated ABC transporter substrate-binding protein GldG [Bacteroidia bacterium]MCZ2247900.1 gliding motility-associated ABC transporter substrate-binding protein GldG [Bacteroidia bacterium]